MWSNIRPLARLIVLALATKADEKSGVIPDEFTPSLGTLAAMTGLSKSVLPGHLRYLSDLGWLKIDAPSRASRYERNRYVLLVGGDDPARVSSPSREPLNDEPQVASSPGDGPLPAVRETDRSTPAEMKPAVRETDRSEDEQSATQTTADQQSDNTSSPSDGLATTTTKPKTKRTSRLNNNRPDVDEICTYLADSVEHVLESKRPEITDRWRTEARLLLDEKRPVQPTVERIKALIDWTHESVFWRKNVMAMPKLREQYDRLRLDAVADFKASKASRARASPHETYKDPVDPDEYDKDV